MKNIKKRISSVISILLGISLIFSTIGASPVKADNKAAAKDLDSKLMLKFFDYEDDGSKTNKNEFSFIKGSTTYPNAWREYLRTVGLAEWDSEKDLVKLTKGRTTSAGNYSSAYPLDPSLDSYRGSYELTLEADADGYYSFDSAKQTMTLQSDKTVTVSDQGSKYLPLGADNFFFGMSFDMEFFYPENSQINGKDMVFSFSGDDDVWVFIDDKLALDIGGIHGAIKGVINFTQKTVTYTYVGDKSDIDPQKASYNLSESGYGEAGVSAPDGVFTIGETVLTFDELGLADGFETGYHTLHFSYFERGATESNCSFMYNLADKDYTYTVKHVFEQKDGSFKILTDDEGRELNTASYTEEWGTALNDPDKVPEGLASEIAKSFDGYTNEIIFAENGDPVNYNDAYSTSSKSVQKDAVVYIHHMLSSGCEYTVRYLAETGIDSGIYTVIASEDVVKTGYHAFDSISDFTDADIKAVADLGTAYEKYEAGKRLANDASITLADTTTVSNDKTIKADNSSVVYVYYDLENEETTVTVNKLWNAPEEYITDVMVDLLEDGEPVKEATLTAENNWTYTFTALKKYRDGSDKSDNALIIYTIAERGAAETEDGIVYTTKDASFKVKYDGGTVINTIFDFIDVYGSKQWKTNDDYSGLKATFELYRNGQPTGSTVTVTGNADFAFRQLPKYDENGSEYAYTVVEIALTDAEGADISNDYISTDSGDNSFINEKNTYDEIKLTKTWRQPAGSAHPETVITLTGVAGDIALEPVEWELTSTPDLYAEEIFTVPTVISGVAVTWTASEQIGEDIVIWTQGRAGENGAVTWFSEGTNMAGGYRASLSSAGKTFNFVNTITGDTSFDIEKIWNGPADKVPAYLDVMVSGNDNSYEYSLTADEKGSFVKTVTLPKYNGIGQEIDYSISETCPENWTPVSASWNEAKTVFTFVNRYTVEETRDITVQKLWDDSGVTGVMHSDVTLMLNGAVAGEALTSYGSVTFDVNGNVTAINGIKVEDMETPVKFSYTFTKLPVYSAGFKTIEYSVTEKYDAQGFSTVVSPSAIGFVVSNIYDAGKYTLSVERYIDGVYYDNYLTDREYVENTAYSVDLDTIGREINANGYKYVYKMSEGDPFSGSGKRGEAKLIKLYYVRNTTPYYPPYDPTPTPFDDPTPTPSEDPTPTPSEDPTPTPSEDPTPTPSEDPTPTPFEKVPSVTPTPYEEIIIEEPDTPLGGDEETPEVPEEIIIPENVTPQGEAEELPQTGTASTGFFYGLGAACIAFGGVLAVSSRKKEEED